MALLRRQKTGLGDFIDISMHHAVLAAMPNVMGPAMARLPPPDPKHERSTGGSAFYQIYDTSDGRHLVLGAQEMKFVKNLLGALGRPELAPLCEWPGPHQKPVMELFEATFRQKPLKHWMDWLATLDICYGPVNTLPEAIEDSNLLQRGMIVKDDQGRKHLAPVVRFRNEPSQPLYREPLLGEHTKEILR